MSPFAAPLQRSDLANGCGIPASATTSGARDASPARSALLRAADRAGFAPFCDLGCELLEWRRRESNPGPRPLGKGVYERSPLINLTRKRLCGPAFFEPGT